MKEFETSTTDDFEIHVGAMLKAHIDSHRLFKSVLARKMERADGVILRFQKSKSMGTAVLIEFCHAMKHNFFRDIADRLPPEFTIAAAPDTSPAEQIAALELEITVLKAEKAVLLEAMR